MKLRLVTALLLLASGASFAQTTAVLPRISITRVDDPNVDTYTFGASACNDTITVRWLNTLTYTLSNQCGQNPMKLWAEAGTSCSTEPDSADTRFTDVPSLTVDQIRQGTFNVKISELPDFKTTTTADGGTLQPCGSAEAFTKTHVICGSVAYALPSGIGCANTTTLAAVPLKLVYDTLPPTQPSIKDYTAQDSAVRLSFNIDSDTTTVVVEVKGPSDVDFSSKGEATASATYVRAENLDNGVTYEVRIRAKDAAGNLSEPSTSVQVTPIRTVGFYGFFVEKGGSETGGCSSVGVGLWPVLVVVLSRRRRSRTQGRETSS